LKDDEKTLTFKKLQIDDIDIFLDWVDDSTDLSYWELFHLNKISDNFLKILDFEFGENEVPHKDILKDFNFQFCLQLNKDVRNPAEPGSFKHPHFKLKIIVGDE
jgi:hypothetical protein